MPPLQPLEQLQRWLLDSITKPTDCVPQAVENLRPSRQQSAAERLAVYQNAYFARLLEVLRELFPCTRFAVGDELFDQFAVGYLRAHPPHSYTLGKLADKWVDYLDSTRPPDWGEFVVELARLEQAIDRIFDAPGSERLPPFEFPLDASQSSSLAFVPGFELHSFDFPTSAYFTDWKAGREPPWPEQVRQFVALFRRDYIVRRYELTEPQYKLLLALHQGLPLGDALARTFDTADPISDQFSAEVNRWFSFWAAERFFAAAIRP
jgi:hypothetical protein